MPNRLGLLHVRPGSERQAMEEEEVDKVVDVQGAFLSAPIGPLVGPRKNGLVSCYWSSSTAPQYSV